MLSTAFGAHALDRSQVKHDAARAILFVRTVNLPKEALICGGSTR